MPQDSSPQTAPITVVNQTPKKIVAPPGKSPGIQLVKVGKSLWSRRWYLGGIIALASISAYYGPTFLFGPQVVGNTAVRAEFVQTVVASGHVEAPFRVEIGTQVTGVVSDVPVRAGQAVKTGDVLIALDGTELAAGVRQSEGVVAQAEAKIRQLREVTLPSAEQSLKEQQATLLNAQKLFSRVTRLVSDGFSTRAALDDATKALDIAKTKVRNAEFLVTTSRPGGSDDMIAQTQADQARAGLATAKSRLGYTAIRSPRDGTLISRAVERGSVVQPGKVLMTLSPAGETQIVVQIDEKNLGLITIGQKALVSADAYAKQTFPAEVFFVNPGIDLLRASIEVKLKVPDPPGYLRQDMTVSVDIEIARHSNAVVLPASDLRDAKSGQAWVMTAVAGRAKRRPVKVGIVSGGKAEIITGLDAGEITVPASNTSILEGQRFRTTASVGAVKDVARSTPLQRPGSAP